MTHPAPNIQDPQNHLDDAAARDAKLRDERFARLHAERVRQAGERAAKGQPSTPRENLEAFILGLQADAAKVIPIASRRPTPSIDGERPAVRSVVERFRAPMIPERFHGVTFDTYVPRTKSQETALGFVKGWVARVKTGQPAMLALIGVQGTGKSHLLYAAANALLEHEITIYARPWYRLADELRYGGEHPMSGTAIEAGDVRRILLSPPWNSRVWFLDEVRPTSGTAFDDTELTKLACHCYDRNYPVLITTNTNPLADVMGAPAASRFRQVVIDGPDARQV